MPSRGGDAFEEALLKAMMEPITHAGVASHLLPYIIGAPGPAKDIVAELLWDEFVNGF